MDDFGSEGLLQRAFGAERFLEAFAEEVVEVRVFGADEVAGGVDAEGEGVAGGAGFACLGAGSGGGLRVAAVGGDLGFGGHGCSLVFEFCSEGKSARRPVFGRAFTLSRSA